MRKLIICICIIYGIDLSAQDLHAIYPINYPKTNVIRQADTSYYFEKFNITITKKKDILYAGKLIYQCTFREYYEYLIEVFEGNGEYLIVSPLSKIGYNGIATPYLANRGIVFFFNLNSGNKYYANLDSIKRIELPVVFELAKTQSHVFMIKDIDEVSNELVLLQGGEEIKEVRIKIHQY